MTKRPLAFGVQVRYRHARRAAGAPEERDDEADSLAFGGGVRGGHGHRGGLRRFDHAQLGARRRERLRGPERGRHVARLGGELQTVHDRRPVRRRLHLRRARHRHVLRALVRHQRPVRQQRDVHARQQCLRRPVRRVRASQRRVRLGSFRRRRRSRRPRDLRHPRGSERRRGLRLPLGPHVQRERLPLRRLLRHHEQHLRAPARRLRHSGRDVRRRRSPHRHRGRRRRRGLAPLLRRGRRHASAQRGRHVGLSHRDHHEDLRRSRGAVPAAAVHHLHRRLPVRQPHRHPGRHPGRLLRDGARRLLGPDLPGDGQPRVHGLHQLELRHRQRRRPDEQLHHLPADDARAHRADEPVLRAGHQRDRHVVDGQVPLHRGQRLDADAGRLARRGDGARHDVHVPRAARGRQRRHRPRRHPVREHHGQAPVHAVDRRATRTPTSARDRARSSSATAARP